MAIRVSCLFRILLVLAALGVSALASTPDFTVGTPDLFETGAGTSPASQQIELDNNTGNKLHIGIVPETQSGGRWLSFSISPDPVPPHGSAQITIMISSANLQASGSPYIGSLIVSDGNTKVTVPITLQIDGVSLSVPTSVNVAVLAGTTAPVKIHIAVIGGDANVLATSNQSWLTGGGSVTAPGDLIMTVDSSSLSVGNHNAGVSLQCQQGGSPCVPAFVSVSANVTPPTSLKINVPSLSFQAYQGRPDPPQQTFQITSSDGSQLSFQLEPTPAWLKLTASTNIASSKAAVITAEVVSSQLTLPSSMTTVTATPANGAPASTIPATATLSPFTIGVMPASPLAVSVASGQQQMVPIQVSTVDGNAATVAIAVQTADKGAWLTAPASVKAPGNFNLTVDASQLPQNSYSGSLTLTCTDATCDPITVKINVTVTAGTLGPQISAVVGAGLSVPPVNAISTNSLITIFGTNLAPLNTSRNVVGSDLMNNALPTNLANTCVEGGGARWGLIYVGTTQINVVANPLVTSGTIPITVITNCGTANQKTSSAMSVKVSTETPQFLFVVADPSGKNEIVAIEATGGGRVGPPNLIPGQTFVQAKAGDVLTAYGVGWGRTTPAAVVGSLPGGAAKLVESYTLKIGTATAKVSYAGLSPCCSGLFQISFEVPSGVSSGNQPVVLTINGTPTPTGAYLAIK